MRSTRMVLAATILTLAFQTAMSAQDLYPKRSTALSGRTVPAPYSVPGLRAAVLSLSRGDSSKPALTVAREEGEVRRNFTTCDSQRCRLRGTDRVVAVTGERLLSNNRGQVTVAWWLDTKEHGITGSRATWVLGYSEGRWHIIGGKDVVVE